jgi:hypothetical protein
VESFPGYRVGSDNFEGDSASGHGRFLQTGGSILVLLGCYMFVEGKLRGQAHVTDATVEPLVVLSLHSSCADDSYTPKLIRGKRQVPSNGFGVEW